MEKVRIDKFLWAVRLFKKRSEAAEACAKGHILLNDMPAKASKEIKTGDIISIKRHVIYRKYKVLTPIEKRIGAKLVNKHIKEITDESELMKLRLFYEYQKTAVPKRTEKGRPTKKDRRQWNKYFDK